MKKERVTTNIRPSKDSSRSSSVALKASVLVGSIIIVKAYGSAIQTEKNTNFVVRPSDGAEITRTLTIRTKSRLEDLTVSVSYTPSSGHVTITIPKAQYNYTDAVQFEIISNIGYDGFFFNSDKSKTNVTTKVFIVKDEVTIASGDSVAVPFYPIVEDETFPSFIGDFDMGSLNIDGIRMGQDGRIVAFLRNNTSQSITLTDETSSVNYTYWITAFCFG